MQCPLCGSQGSRGSWLGHTHFAGREFAYRECLGCGSVFVDPMPGDDLLKLMYGRSYFQDTGSQNSGEDDPKDPARVARLLGGWGTGSFLDYGCGDGRLLELAKKAGWSPIGVEFDAAVARGVSERTTCRVITEADVDNLPTGMVDVLHVGDVLEHMADPERELRRMLRLVLPGGHFVAQGPLEAQPNLFQWFLRAARGLRPKEAAAIPPYHVSLATTKGQRALFDRVDLGTVSFDVTEVAWPAPARLTRAVSRNPRATVLHAARRLSQMTSPLIPGASGNRYFFVGSVP